jgi:hypothetical protein
MKNVRNLRNFKAFSKIVRIGQVKILRPKFLLKNVKSTKNFTKLFQNTKILNGDVKLRQIGYCESWTGLIKAIFEMNA